MTIDHSDDDDDNDDFDEDSLGEGGGGWVSKMPPSPLYRRIPQKVFDTFEV